MILVALLTIAASGASAQLPELENRPEPYVAVRPWTQKDLAQQEALKQYTLGVLCERDERLLEAVSHYEESAKLDADALPVLKALLLLYIGVDRQEESLVLAQRVLERDPQDYQTAYVAARLLRSRGQFKEACNVLLKGLLSPDLKDRSDLHQQIEFDLGGLYERQELYEDAAAAFARSAAILDHPDDFLEARTSLEELQFRSAEIHERVGRNLLQARKYDQAAAAFHQAQAKYPAGANRLYFFLAQIHLQQGKLAEALIALDGYLCGLPQGTEAYELKIAILQKLRRETEIVPWLENASNQDRFNVALKMLLGRQYGRANLVGKAEKLYRDLGEASPSEELYRDLFLLYKNHLPGGAESCVKLLNTTIDSAACKDNPLAGNSAPAQAKAMIGALRENPTLAVDLLKAGTHMLKTQQFHLETLHLLAVLADRNDLAPESERYYRVCLLQPLPQEMEPMVYGGLLRVLWKAKRYEAIVEVCRWSMKKARTTNLVLLQTDLARALAQIGKFDDALTEAARAIEIAKDSEKLAVRHLRVRLLLQADRPAEAESECQALLKDCTMPGEILEVRYLLSSVYANSNRQAHAEAELTACLKIDPNNATVNNDLAYMCADQNKNLAEAEVMIRKAIELDRKNRQWLLKLGPNADKETHDNACYIDTLGWVLFRRGDFNAARLQLEYAGSLPDGDDPVIWEHLGEVFTALHMPDRARQAWQKALDFYDQGKRHKMEQRYRALQEKLRTVSSPQ
jgi:tetratricopeptide (TPR) repeat protein